MDSTSDRVNQHEITCRRMHRVFVVWVPEKKCFAFTCKECKETSPIAVSALGWVICILKPGSQQ